MVSAGASRSSAVGCGAGAPCLTGPRLQSLPPAPNLCAARPPPAGAKTLCNACGVKRTRKLRAEQEGAKRRKLSTAPQASPAKHHAAYAGSGKYPGRAAAAAAAAVIESYGSLEPELDAWGLPSAALPAPSGTRARPPRRAAEEAAFRTARYARTGGCPAGAGQCAAAAAARAAPAGVFAIVCGILCRDRLQCRYR